MTERALKIAYLCDITPLDPNLYSGGNARIYRALCDHAGEVTILSNGWSLAEPLRRLVHMLPEALNLRLRWRLHLALNRVIARGVRRELERGGFDVLFCAYSFQSLAGVQVPPGVISAFTADAMPTLYKQSEVGASFGSYLSASRYLDPWVARHEACILRDLDLALWPSLWVSQGTQRVLDVPGENAHVVPWGANVAPIACPKAMPGLEPGKPIELLFVGRDWAAKGGPLARAVLEALLARGAAARLTVIGTHPPEADLLSQMNVIGPLDKSIPGDLAQFEAAFAQAHFLINPSFESYGFAYCEAAGYGLPALSLNVGGVPVREGVTGHSFDPGVAPGTIADRVLSYAKSPAAYERLRKTAREEYETKLNWDAWGKDVARILRQASEAKRQS